MKKKISGIKEPTREEWFRGYYPPKYQVDFKTSTGLGIVSLGNLQPIESKRNMWREL